MADRSIPGDPTAVPCGGVMDLPCRWLALDLEVSPSGEIFKIGAVLEKDTLVALHGGQTENILRELAHLASRADAVVGHNIVRHDLRVLRSRHPDHPLLRLPAIDTLALSPIAFPENPYHRLIKDHKMVRESLNDPVADARLSLEVLADEWRSLAGLRANEPGLFAALHFLLGTGDDPTDVGAAGFELFFRHLGGARPGRHEAWEQLRSLVRRLACGSVQLDATLLETSAQRHTLAYAVTWLRVAGSNSVLPPWVRHSFPDIVPLLRRLRDHPCDALDCSYCRRVHDPRGQLRAFFGFDDFRPHPAGPDGRSLQEQIIAAGMRDESLLATLATGGGKSLCYQLPALVRNFRRGVLTIVISPLQALMKDQVDGLARRTGTPFAAALYGMLTLPERGEVLRRLARGDLAILYVSPEQLRNRSFREAIAQREIGCWVFDEAHCLSKWGHDFRPDYLYAGRFIREFSQSHGLEVPAIACFTATAKQEVREEILAHFQAETGRTLRCFEGGVERDNLRFAVEQVAPQDKLERLERHLADAFGPAARGSAIVFRSRRAFAEETAEFLAHHGWAAAHFHAGLAPSEKKRIQDEFLAGELRVICATNAFGMGIDKDDVRLVIHADTPGSLENYLQEAGRAGRDGRMASCLLLYDNADCEEQFRLGAQSELDRRDLAQVLRVLRRAQRRGREAIVITSGEILRDEELSGDLGGPEALADTRVRTAVAWLERAGFLQRDENVTFVFQARPLVKDLAEAEARMIQLQLSERERGLWLAILRELMNAPSTGNLTVDRLALLPEFAGYLSQAEGSENRGRSAPEYLSARILKILRSMAESRLLERDTLFNAFVRYKVADHSRVRLDRVLHTERRLVDLLAQAAPDPEDWVPLDVRRLNQHLLDEGCSASLELVRLLLRSLSEDGRGFAGSHGSLELRLASRDFFRVRVRRRWTALEELAEKRRRVASLILDRLLAKIPDDTAPRADVLVDFSLEELHRSVHDDLLLRSDLRDIDAALERALMYLHEQQVIVLQGGLAVFRSAMTIRLDPTRRADRYQSADFEPLQHHYRERVLQVHVMGEYARRGLQDDAEARDLVRSYFSQPKDEFLRRFFPAKHDLLHYATTAQSFQRIVTELRHPSQIRIVTASTSQNHLVLAGPGSGKTRVVVHRCAYLLRVQRVPARSILVCCFNRQAALELRRRLADLVGEEARGVIIQTYHGLALRLLGYSLQPATPRSAGRTELDFDALIEDALRLLRGESAPAKLPDDEIRDRLLSGFRHILVDEYQDIDESQYQLISALAGRTSTDSDQRLSILAVGDDDQNIYTFRGANVRFIRQFQQDYQAQIHHLVDNFRSTSHIITTANQLISHNQDRMKVEYPIRIDPQRQRLPPGGEFGRRDPVSGGRVQILTVDSPAALGSAALGELQRWRDLGVTDWSRFAVLSSTHHDLAQVRAAAELADLPFRWIAGRESLPPLPQVREIAVFLDHLRAFARSTLEVSEARANLAELFPSERYDTHPWVCFLHRQLDTWSEDHPNTPAPVSELLEFLYEACADSRRQGDLGQGVTLSTIHAAKGTEYDHVLLVGSWSIPAEKVRQEEGRRLLYVGLTRARQTLALLQTARTAPGFVDALSGPAVLRRALAARPSETPAVTYETLGLDGLYLNYAAAFPPYDAIHRALAGLQPGSVLEFQERSEGHLALVTPEGLAVARLSARGEAEWRPRLAAIRRVRVLAMIRRHLDQTLEPVFRERARVEQWEIPFVEIVCQAAPRSDSRGPR